MVILQMMLLGDVEHFHQSFQDVNEMMSAVIQLHALTLCAETLAPVVLTLDVTSLIIDLYVHVYQAIMEILRLLVLLLAVNQIASVNKLTLVEKENVPLSVVLMIFHVEGMPTALESVINRYVHAQ
jgi:hypothetical protein